MGVVTVMSVLAVPMVVLSGRMVTVSRYAYSYYQID
jgi:hypothetical protein